MFAQLLFIVVDEETAWGSCKMTQTREERKTKNYNKENNVS